MPADSERPALPHTFRPIGVRFAVYGFGSMLVVLCLAVWFAFPPEVRAQFTGFQLGTLIFLGLLFGAAGYAMARSRLVAHADRLTVVNGYKRRDFEWTQVVAVRLMPGSPWATLDLSDGTTVSAMGIQGSDGRRALAQVRDLRSLVEDLSRTDRDD